MTGTDFHPNQALLSMMLPVKWITSDKRPDVIVYDSSYQKVVLLVEVQSSPIQQSVIKEAIKYHRSARRNGQGSEDTETTVKQAGGTPISLLRRQLDPQYNSL